jgi:hypothetical protein
MLSLNRPTVSGQPVSDQPVSDRPAMPSPRPPSTVPSSAVTNRGADPAESGRAPHRARVLGLGAPLVVLAAAGLLLIGVANVEVARGRDAVELQLAEARAATARVPQQLASGDTAGLATSLATLDRSSASADHGSAGFLWAVAGRANLNGGALRAVRRNAHSSATLAVAAAALHRSLAPLGPLRPLDSAASSAPAADSTDPGRLDQLDDLARGLSGYATAAIRVDDPSAPALKRAALAAGLLPNLAGAEQPRTWTFCGRQAGPCTEVTIDSGRLGPLTISADGPDRSDPTPSDLLVIGAGPDDVFGPSTGRQGGRWDVPSMFGLLYHLGEASITVHSVVGVEQQALDQLTGGPLPPRP